MLAVERRRRGQRHRERRAKPARRSSRLIYPKTAARGLHQSRFAHKNQNPQNGQHRARFDWGFGAVCFGASPVAAVFGSAPGSATPPEHRSHSNPNPPAALLKQDISTLLGIGHFYFALTWSLRWCRNSASILVVASRVRADRMIESGILNGVPNWKDCTTVSAVGDDPPAGTDN